MIRKKLTTEYTECTEKCQRGPIFRGRLTESPLQSSCILLHDSIAFTSVPSVVKFGCATCVELLRTDYADSASGVVVVL